MPDFINGEILLLDKPQYWTSFELVKRVRYEIQRKLSCKNLKVGHAGTLDPLATGLMIICTGKATKNIVEYQDLRKEYIAKIKLGSTTPSFDLETAVDHEFPTEHITPDLINDVLNGFEGSSMQEPPVYSARFVEGKRAYEHARKGKNVSLKASGITIHSIEQIEFAKPVLELRISCSKGTYIRALARDIGIRLNSGAHLIGLKRTAIGQYNLGSALTFNEFKNFIALM